MGASACERERLNSGEFRDAGGADAADVADVTDAAPTDGPEPTIALSCAALDEGRFPRSREAVLHRPDDRLVVSSPVRYLGTSQGIAGGSLLVLKLRMPFGSRHVIGRFRVSVTNTARPVRVTDVPDDVAQALRVPTAERNDAQKAVVHRAYLSRDEELRNQLRLGATQDLAWALATSPAFLFNR